MLDLQFTDIEQDIILISKGHDFTKKFLSEQDLKTINFIRSEANILDRLTLLHQEYYRWGDRVCLYVIYENILDICFKFYDYEQEIEFRFKDCLKEIRKDKLTGRYKETIDLEHIINNLICYISNTKVRENDEDLYELKGKYVEG